MKAVDNVVNKKNAYGIMLKRIFDYSLALAGMFIFSPLWLIIPWAIWLEDRGPIFFIQERVGYKGAIFKGLKFRSMVKDAEKDIGPVQAKDNDPRITKMGRFLRKTAMDELPQLLNILKGDMSFVGPRALRPTEIELNGDNRALDIFQIPGFKMRASVQPGLTGVAQIYASRYLSREEKFQYDLWYIKNHNLWLDIMLILKSVMISLNRRWDMEAKPPCFFVALIFISLVIFHSGKINAFAQDDKVMRGVMDVHSNISDGLSSLEKIAVSAKERGLSVVIFGDSALRRWEYGIWPLRNIVKKVYQENSVLRLGAVRYTRRLKMLKEQFPDLVFVPGVEVSPYFYWEGSPFTRNLALIDYYKQFLVLGLSPEDYQGMPIVGNRRFFYLSKNMLFGLWPILLLILGLRLFKRKALGISLIAIGILFLCNNIPFPASSFNVYQGKQGIKPYQELIDYVNRKGGLIFWAHPDKSTQTAYFAIETYTSSHIEDLAFTKDYTGFAVTHSFKITEPGGIWDGILLDYIEGKRKKPAWAVGTLHYIGANELGTSPETIFFIKEPKEADILDALRQGRMHVRFNLKKEPLVFLDKFEAHNTGSGFVRITIDGRQISVSEPLKIELIRNGKIFKTIEESRDEWGITVEDNFLLQEKKVYYRLKISNSSNIILSNPIFIEQVAPWVK